MENKDLNMHIGSILKKEREKQNLSQQEVAEYVGVTKSAVSRWENGEVSNIGRTKIKKMAEILNISPVTIVLGDAFPKDPYLTEQIEKGAIDLRPSYKEPKEAISNLEPIDFKDMIKIPILGFIRAGNPIDAEEHIIGYDYIEKEKVNGSKLYELRVEGDSMNQEGIQEGDFVIVREQPEVYNGEIAVVLVNNHDATVKKFYQTDTTITLMPSSDNPDHAPIIFDSKKTEVKVLGKVIGTKRFFK